MNKPLDEFADEQVQARYKENQDLARTARAIKTELTETRLQLKAASDEAAELQRELDLRRRDWSAARPDWALSPKRATKENHGTLLAFLSDTHYGEVVRPKEMGGYNAYGLAIAAARTERFFTRTIRLAQDYLAGVTYDGIYLAVGGDLVSGDIHDELVQTNEAATYETIRWAIPRLAEGIELLRKAFGRVHVVSAPGNHGRDSAKPRYKGRSAHNADTLIMRLVSDQFAKLDTVTFDVPDTNDVGFQIYDSTFTMEHGDELGKKFTGTAEIGVLGPLMRGTNRKRTSLQAQGRDARYALWAHFHQLIPVPSRGFVANGSLKGFDEYARDSLFKPEPAQQALMVVTPEHGITTTMPVFVSDRKAEGW